MFKPDTPESSQNAAFRAIADLYEDGMSDQRMINELGLEAGQLKAFKAFVREHRKSKIQIETKTKREIAKEDYEAGRVDRRPSASPVSPQEYTKEAFYLMFSAQDCQELEVRYQKQLKSGFMGTLFQDRAQKAKAKEFGVYCTFRETCIDNSEALEAQKPRVTDLVDEMTGLTIENPLFGEGISKDDLNAASTAALASGETNPATPKRRSILFSLNLKRWSNSSSFLTFTPTTSGIEIQKMEQEEKAEKKRNRRWGCCGGSHND